MSTGSISHALKIALEAAEAFVGATAPNPPVGAAGLDLEGNILSIQAHERAGTGHAEAKVIEDLRSRRLLDKLHSLVITLEPCDHHGKTPPCTSAILGVPSLRSVYFGAIDPNPQVAGSGAARLAQAGISVKCLDDPHSKILIRAFSHWILTGRPWVTVKTAIHASGTMLPPAGQKTFTSPESLKLAHRLRKRADAILTGSGTILADDPEFTVRHVPDHPGKVRWLAIMDRRGRIPPEWLENAEERGFRAYLGTDLNFTLKHLSEQGVLEVLVEAGPTLSEAILRQNFWNEHVVIRQSESSVDQVEIRSRLG